MTTCAQITGFKFQLLAEGEVRILSLSGYMGNAEFCEVDKALSRLLEQKHRRVILDLTTFSFTTAISLARFLVCGREFRRHGEELKLAGLSPWLQGKETFKQGVQAMCRAAEDVLRQCDLTVSQISCIIPHQSNRRIIDAFARRMGATPEQVFMNLEKVGNTCAASIPIALAEAVETGRVKQGDLVLLVAFGGGLTWGATIIQW